MAATTGHANHSALRSDLSGTSEAVRTPGPWRFHDMEANTIVAGRPGGEVCNTQNGFGDQRANAAFIVRACNAHDELVGLLNEAQAYVGFVVATTTADTNRVNGSKLLQDIDAALSKATGEA